MKNDHVRDTGGENRDTGYDPQTYMAWYQFGQLAREGGQAVYHAMLDSTFRPFTGPRDTD